ncbi:MAG TPA: HIT family protein [Iamia sp.]|nr:HIT family protein [Iamia sp.]
MTRPEDCVFCGIVDGSVPSSPVVDTGTVLAFVDIDPVTPGHTLVIPKEHLPDLADLDDELAAEMMAVARRVAAALRRTDLRCEGVNLFYADGEAAFQEVFHSHLHVFPRYADDGFVIKARWGSSPRREELDRIAAQLVAEVASEDETDD